MSDKSSSVDIDNIGMVLEAFWGAKNPVVDDMGNGSFIGISKDPITGETHCYYGRFGGNGIKSGPLTELTDSQLPLFERVKSVVLSRVAAASEAGKQEFMIVEDGEFPELFKPFWLNNMNGIPHHEMLPVWLAIQEMLELMGLDAYPCQHDHDPIVIQASPAKSVLF